MSYISDEQLLGELRLAKCKLDLSPKHNWVEDAGGLPDFIHSIACALIRDHGFTVSRAIATAVNRIKAWSSGGGNVNADTRAKASAALAEWEKKKASANVKATNPVDKVVALAAPLFQSSIEKVALASRTFSEDKRDEYAGKGVAMKDGSFPIPDRGALRRAIQSFGRGKGDKAAIKAHIKKRAKALGATDMLPEGW